MEASFEAEVEEPNDELLWRSVLPADVRSRRDFWWGPRVVHVETLSDLRNTGIYGGLIGILVLFAFLHRGRTTLVAASCIPLSVLAACAVIYMRGQALNTIVLLGLVLGVGMLIDNAVVIVESIQLRLQRGESPARAAREGAQVRRAGVRQLRGVDERSRRAQRISAARLRDANRQR